VLFLPLGIWIADHIGFDALFIGTALTAAIGLAVSRMLPSTHPGQRPTHGIMAELLDPAIARPTVVFSIATLAIGILITYLALAVPDDARNVAAIGLLVQAICTALTRWGAGRLGDAVGSRRILAPSMLLAALGMVCIIATDSSVAVIGGMALFGIGFGGAQNASLAVMFDRAPRERFAQVSVIWNLAYDAGMGIGAVGFGLISRQTGYPWGFAMVAVLLFAAMILAALDRSPASAKPHSMSTA
jgi:predicted MFS family arabinose efflux permease